MDWHDVFADANSNFVMFLLIVLPLVQWVTGVLRAFANGTFDVHYLDVFIRTDIAGRVLPTLILILLGRIVSVAAPAAFNVPGLDLGILTGAGIGIAVVYLVVVVKSIIDNVTPTKPDNLPVE